MSLKAREAKVHCVKHPFANNSHKTKECNAPLRRPCSCGSTDHHQLLCPKLKISSHVAITAKSSKGSTKIEVLLKTMFVRGAKGNQNYGLLQDNASTDNFITHSIAKAHGLEGEKVVIEIEGINDPDNPVIYETKLYQVPIKTLSGEIIYIECYGLNSIATEAVLPSKEDYWALCKKFGIPSSQVRRPRRIDILLSQKEAYLMSDEVKLVKEKMKLYSGPLGLVLSGCDPGLKYSEHKAEYPSIVRRVTSQICTKFSKLKTKSDREILNFFEYESVGIEGESKRNAMTLKDQREYQKFKENMVFDEKGTTSDPGPYWRISYPWEKPREAMPDNYAAVLGVMDSTTRKLDKNPSWRKTYESQLLDLVERGYAREISNEELDTWKKEGKKIYYIAHQMVVNPDNKTTPIRTVFNSSQVYKGHSLNTSWSLGPDVISELQGVLLRFREDQIAAQGDIAKMFYSVRVSPEDERMQLFVWKFAGDTRLKTFAMTRIIMGHKPSSNISVIALKETALLGDNKDRYPDAYVALHDDSYVDNTFVGAENHEKIKAKIEEIELVAGQAGFIYKPWTISGQDIGEQVIGAEEGSEETEKALGILWSVKEDKLSVRVKIGLGNKRSPKDVSLLPQLGIEESATEPPPVQSNKQPPQSSPVLKLTLRICLSIHSKTYDPLGIFLPTKMIGNLLFRITTQFLNKDGVKGIQWDVPLDDEHSSKWSDYFRMLHALKDIKIDRCVKPLNTDDSYKPDLVTFDDGNPDAFGSPIYGRWKLLNGLFKCRLLASKAKLGPILRKGETSKNELNAAVTAVRLKCWVEEQSNIKFGQHIPFLDSRIVQDMIKKDSYLFNTFAGVRVDEIQTKSDPHSWLHIPSKENYCADILTKGITPDKLGPDSTWQQGPEWLTLEKEHWPVTNSDPVLSPEEYETVHSFKRLVKSKITKSVNCSSNFFSRVKKTNLRAVDKYRPVGCLDSVNSERFDDTIARCGSIRSLMRITAYILRLGGKAAEGKYQHKEISASEMNDAWLFLLCWEQRQRLDKKNHQGLILVDREVELSNGTKLTLVMLAARHANHKEVPFLPCGALAKLIVMHYHNRYHVDIDDTVVHVRNEVWIPKARKLASDLDKNCKICLLKRKKLAAQVMGNLPDCRVEPAPAFQSVCLDLFGPIIIRDDCVKKGPRVMKKVYGVVITCTATRAVYLDVAIDYSTEAFLHVLRRFKSDRGDVRLINSDPGSQLIGAANELAAVREGWSKEELIRFGAENGINWKTCMPTSQHQNGAAEILVKLTKGILKALLAAIGRSVLSLNELNTVLKETANICNERPIGIRPNSVSNQEYLSPNTLLLGRSSDRINAGPFQAKDVYDENPGAMQTRFLFVQRVVDKFWKEWTKKYLPTLLVRQKWHHQKRNLSCGDICLIEDQNTMRGEWRLGRITKVFPDELGVVRNVELKVAQKFDGKASYKFKEPSLVKRHVGRLIVLHTAEEASEALVDEKGSVEPAGGECKDDFAAPLAQVDLAAGDLEL